MTTRVLVLTDDRLGLAMAGPAIRALELAQVLGSDTPVTLASTQPVGEVPDLSCHVQGACDTATLRHLVDTHDVLVAGGLFFAQHPWMLALDKALVLDLYAPFLLEDVARLSALGELGEWQHAKHRQLLDRQLRRADFMICASDRQRDYWLGRLCALGRLTPKGHAQDPTLEHLIAVVPFGLSPTPPIPSVASLRGVLPGVDADSSVFVWGGGLWDWLDPLTPLRAVAALATRAPGVKLVFLAGPSPNPTTPEMPMNARAKQLASELGVLGKSVHFIERWVPYQARGSLLLEADAGLSAHLPTLESRFAFRTRTLDYLWAGRPILCTQGDVLADMVASEGLGLVLPPGDSARWADALQRIAEDSEFVNACRNKLQAVRPRFAWREVARPLVAYIKAPSRSVTPPTPPSWALDGPTGTLAKAWLVLRAEGATGLARRIERRRARQKPHEPSP
jgi:hypothetical protein